MEFKSVDVVEFVALYKNYKDHYEEIRAFLSGDVSDSFEVAMQSGEVLMGMVSVSAPKAKEVDRLADRAWTSLSRSLEAWEHSFVEDEHIPLMKEEVERRGLARALRAGLVGGDLRFLRMQYHDQWRESERRLLRLDTQTVNGKTYREALEGLQLGLMVRRLERIHEAYGRALGIKDANKAVEQMEVWEGAFFHFLHGLHFKHRERTEANQTLFDLVMKPYEAALERGLERRRQARSTAAESTDPTDPTPLEPTPINPS
ncbi:hypothetical protein L6R29_17205 [Myxococcota bacterium]|nr:hypothetical protein [Myxococcota bacterium]